MTMFVAFQFAVAQLFFSHTPLTPIRRDKGSAVLVGAFVQWRGARVRRQGS
jgi:ABC-type Co2+ transport system permease subunit